jgi:hypothetical protein
MENIRIPFYLDIPYIILFLNSNISMLVSNLLIFIRIRFRLLDHIFHKEQQSSRTEE